VVAIEQASFSDPWTPEMFQVHLGGDPFIFAVAEDEQGTLLGFAVALVAADTAELFEIAVAHQARRRGVGQMLLKHVVARCYALGAATMTLEVRESNAPARALYERHGFVAVGRRTHYYRDPLEDGLLLWRRLTGEGEESPEKPQ
jgi:ribosomal-protein-alanine N-acetyltransferase